MSAIAKRGDRGVKVRVIQRMLKLYPDGIFGPLTEEAVREFQDEHQLNVTGQVDLSTWQQMFGTTLIPATSRNIKEIIVHCTATPDGRGYTVEDITRWHIERGFATIGYHYVVYRDGSIHEGRDIDIAGAHCTGHNTCSIGVCYVGGMDKTNRYPCDTRTDAQKASLVKLLTDLRKFYPDAKIHGHRDFAAKACPSFDATREYSSL